MKRLLVLMFLGATTSLFAQDGDRQFALKGGIANASVAWLGPITTASLKFGAGAEYWFNKNVALGIDIGMGGEGYGKVIGTTSQSLVNLKTGAFIVDPGLTAEFALNPMAHFRPYSSIRLGFPLYSGYSGAFSLGPALGTLIRINDWAALDVAMSFSAVANFKFNYLATVFSVGAIGFRVFI